MVLQLRRMLMIGSKNNYVIFDHEGYNTSLKTKQNNKGYKRNEEIK